MCVCPYVHIHKCTCIKLANDFDIYKALNANFGPQFKNSFLWGTWVAQPVKHLTLAQVMISWFVSSSSTLGSVLTVQRLEPVLDSVSLSLPLPFSCSVSLKNK